MAIAVVIAAIVAVIILVAVLWKQGSPGRLSEEDGRRPRRDDVVERPAGPDAESMAPEPPDQPTDDRPGGTGGVGGSGGTAAWPEEGPTT
jgi:hypothetical protein